MRELFAGADEVNVADILKATNTIPMEELKLKLGKLTETVQDELFEVINHDFAKFQEILRQVCDVNIEELRTFRDQYSHAKNDNEVKKVIIITRFYGFRKYTWNSKIAMKL